MIWGRNAPEELRHPEVASRCRPRRMRHRPRRARRCNARKSSLWSRSRATTGPWVSAGEDHQEMPLALVGQDCAPSRLLRRTASRRMRPRCVLLAHSSDEISPGALHMERELAEDLEQRDLEWPKMVALEVRTRDHANAVETRRTSTENGYGGHGGHLRRETEGVRGTDPGRTGTTTGGCERGLEDIGTAGPEARVHALPVEALPDAHEVRPGTSHAGECGGDGARPVLREVRCPKERAYGGTLDSTADDGGCLHGVRIMTWFSYRLHSHTT